MDPDVPLLIPEVNPDHIDIIPHQRKSRGWDKGFIVTNPNCSTIAMVLALAPLHKAFGITKVLVTTLQAVSGAGYPGVASLDAIDNAVPFIGGEEPKMESETQKLLGTFSGNFFVDAPIVVSAHCNRIATTDGHLECVSLSLEKRPTIKTVIEALANFRSAPQELGLPSAPARPIIVRSEEDRPQPKYDRTLEKGMASVVGRVRECPVLGYKFAVLGHNTIRGAAGGAILNAELLKARGYLD
jgi:aspartate-semialdehyde dehydrogenase